MARRKAQLHVDREREFKPIVLVRSIRSGYAENQRAPGVGEACVDVCAPNSTVTLCGIATA